MSQILAYNEIQQSSFSSKQTQQPIQVQTIDLSKYKVIIFFTLMGFYFLIFSVIELVTNYQQTTYQFTMKCFQKTCTAQTNFISFTSGNSIYIFLKNKYLSQADISFKPLQNTQKTSFITNQQIGKNISIINTLMSSKLQGYPNGQFISYFPQSTFKIQQKSTHKPLNISVNDLSIYQPQIKNKNDLSKQWANLQSQRFGVWNEQQIAYGICKKWGTINNSISGNYTITLSSKNNLSDKFKNGLSIFLTDGKALSGKNLPLCIINLIFSILLFIFSGISFIFGFGTSQKIQQNNSDNQI